LPSDEKFREAFQVELASYSASKTPYAPDEHRPELFKGLSMLGDRWGAFLGFLYRLFSSDSLDPAPVNACADPELRPKWQKQRKVFWGAWESTAGQMLASMHPRSKTGVNTYLVLTSSSLRTVYLHRRRGSYHKLGNATALGWVCPLTQLAYLRKHPSLSCDCYEFGFSDGLGEYWPCATPRNSSSISQTCWRPALNGDLSQGATDRS
jgi:hypothetical protein